MPAATLAHKPAGLSEVDAGSIPIAGLSAWAGIVSTGKLAKGQRVLIHAGGVGSFAAQLASISAPRSPPPRAARTSSSCVRSGPTR
jgi:NADPH:quinone reductase-like Zn-dependent oxidoreductase